MRTRVSEQSLKTRTCQSAIAWAIALLAGAQTFQVRGTDFRGCRFIGLTNFSGFSAARQGSEAILTSPKISPNIDWNELIVSWNAEMHPDNYLKIEARGIFPDHATRYYALALWSDDDRSHARESVQDQKDDDGDVLTDTLALKRHGAEVELRMILGTSTNAPLPRLKFVGLSFGDTRAKPAVLPPNKSAWAKTIAVPERSQMIYPSGEIWCSPASVSMVLAHWGNVLHRSELNRDVPEIAKAVFDKNWPGTGNWPFNTAFAGSFPGLRAYVARLSDVSELEDWIAKEIPVVLSVSYGELKGTGERPNDGHLVVCVGFTGKGDPIINDPGTRENVRKTFARENLVKAWVHSNRTVYLIYPETAAVPIDRFGHWFTR